MKTLRLQFHVLPQSTTAAALKKLAEHILCAKVLLHDPGLDVYRLPDGTLLEFHGTTAFNPANIFEQHLLVPSFPVTDIDIAVSQMRHSGAELLDGITRTCDTHAYCYLRLPGQTIVGLHEDLTFVKRIS